MKTNIRQYLVYFLMALIVSQSVGIMADVHKFHQSGTEHLSFDHEHTPIDGDAHDHHDSASPEATSADMFDCHHCCHCHGVAYVFIGGDWAGVAFADPSEEPPTYRFVSLSFQKSPDTPPPIS